MEGDPCFCLRTGFTSPFLKVFLSTLQNVMNKLHTISVPYSVMKTCPLSWVQRVHAHKGNCVLTQLQLEALRISGQGTFNTSRALDAVVLFFHGKSQGPNLLIPF